MNFNFPNEDSVDFDHAHDRSPCKYHQSINDQHSIGSIPVFGWILVRTAWHPNSARKLANERNLTLNGFWHQLSRFMFRLMVPTQNNPFSCTPTLWTGPPSLPVECHVRGRNPAWSEHPRRCASRPRSTWAAPVLAWHLRNCCELLWSAATLPGAMKCLSAISALHTTPTWDDLNPWRYFGKLLYFSNPAVFHSPNRPSSPSVLSVHLHPYGMCTRPNFNQSFEWSPNPGTPGHVVCKLCNPSMKPLGIKQPTNLRVSGREW